MNALSSATKSLHYILSGVADLLLPHVCTACGRDVPTSEGLCASCSERLLTLVALPYCPRCGATVGPNIPVREDGCWACGHVLPRFAKVIRLGPYAHPLRGLVGRLKYHNRDAVAGRLGDMLAHAVESHCPDENFDVIVPVPMYWRRRLQRGYNHSAVLAGVLGRRLKIPVGEELRRTRNTPPQVRLSRTRRIENVKGAFVVKSKRYVAAARVLLIDDVTTTGATANESARTLLAAGASSVHLAVVSKAEPPRAYTQHWEPTDR